MILHAELLGEGRPVVLLHGLFGRGRNLLGVARVLAAAGHRAILLDLRNHGASPHAPGMAYRDLAEDVHETLDRIGALPAGVLGHSMGGKAAMALALTRPEAVTRLLVADIAPVAYVHGNAGVAAAMQGLALSGGVTREGASAALAASVPDQAVRGFLLQNLQFGAAPAWRIGLDEIAASIGVIEGWPEDLNATPFGGPALFLSGTKSDYVAGEGRAAARRLFPAARFVALKEAGHWLHADQPEAFAAAAGSFFGGE